MGAYPYLTWVTIGGLLVLLAGMAFGEAARPQLLLSPGVAAVVLGVGFARDRTKSR